MSKKVYVEQSAVLEALQATINKQAGKPDTLQFVSDILDAPFVPPPADVKPVVRSEWFEGDYIDQWYCPECKFTVIAEDYPSWNFCPNCGADMREEKDDEQ